MKLLFKAIGICLAKFIGMLILVAIVMGIVFLISQYHLIMVPVIIIGFLILSGIAAIWNKYDELVKEKIRKEHAPYTDEFIEEIDAFLAKDIRDSFK